MSLSLENLHNPLNLGAAGNDVPDCNFGPACNNLREIALRPPVEIETKTYINLESDPQAKGIHAKYVLEDGKFKIGYNNPIVELDRIHIGIATGYKDSRPIQKAYISVKLGEGSFAVVMQDPIANEFKLKIYNQVDNKGGNVTSINLNSNGLNPTAELVKKSLSLLNDPKNLNAVIAATAGVASTVSIVNNIAGTPSRLIQGAILKLIQQHNP
jgi:hypothetical protein